MAGGPLTIEAWTNEQKALHRERVALDRALSTFFRGEKDMGKAWEQQNSSARNEVAKARGAIQEFGASLETLRTILREISAGLRAPGNLQKQLERYEGKLYNFKQVSKNEYEAMMIEEEILTKELEQAQGMIDEWAEEDELQPHDGELNKSANATAERTNINDRAKEAIQRQAQIGAIDRKIATLGGRTGGWDSRDHDSFLRLWTQVVGDAAPTERQSIQIVQRLPTMVPGKNEQEFRDHLEWYTRYHELQSQKKNLLDEWKKQAKRPVQPIQPETALTEPSIDEEMARAAEEERRAKREAVRQWRREREEKKMQEDDEQRQEQEMAKQRQLVAKKERQLQQRRQVQEYQRIKEQEKQRLLEAKELLASQRGPAPTPEEQQQRRARDMAIAKKRREIALEKTNKKSAREKALESAKPVVEVDSDPDRLLQGTKASKAWTLTEVSIEERQMQREQQGAHSRTIAGGGYDLKFTGRAVPAWMK